MHLKPLTYTVVYGDNNNNNNNNDTDDDNDEGGEYPITLRTNYNTIRCEIRCAYRINFGNPNRSLLGFSRRSVYCGREDGTKVACQLT